MSVVSLLHQLASERKEAPLGLVASRLSPEQRDVLLEHVRDSRNELAWLSTQEQKQWGAAAMLLGAGIFRERSPYRYTTLAELEFDNVDATVRDALAAGCDYWGITLARSVTNHRLLIATMVAEAGAAWGTLLQLARLVRVEDRWSFVQRSSLHDVAHWVTERRDHYTLSASDRRVLAREDGIYAAAMRLKRFAAVLDEAQRAGAHDLVALDRYFQPRSILTARLDAPDDHEAMMLVRTWLTEVTQHLDEAVELRLDRSTGVDRPVLRLPARLLPLDLGPEVDRLRLAAGHDDAVGTLYRRDPDGTFTTASRDLPFHGETMFIVRQLRDYAGVHSQSFAEVELPLLALFNEQGDQVTTAEVGTPLFALSAHAFTLLGVEARAVGSHYIARFEMPEDGLNLIVNGEPVEVAPHGQRIEVALSGANVPGLRFGRARAFFQPPRVAVAADQRFDWQLKAPDGSTTTGEHATDGVLRLPNAAQVGRYTLRLETATRTRTVEWVLLPAAEFRVESSTEGTEVSVLDASATLRVGEREAAETLTFGPDESGRRLVEVRLPALPQLVGSWRVALTPQRVAVVTSRDGEVDPSPTFATLYRSGGLLVSGAPRLDVTVRIAKRHWSHRLAAHGTWFLPFSVIPAADLERDSISIDVRWGASAFTPVLVLVELTRMRPKVTVTGDEASFDPPAEVDQAELRVVPAWQPWAAVRSIPLRLTPERWFADLSTLDGPHQGALYSNGRRLTGSFLAKRDGERPTASIEQHLWDGTIARLKPTRPGHALREHLDAQPNAEQLRRRMFQNIIALGGHRFFFVAEHACDASTRLRLREFLAGEDDDIVRFFASCKRPLIATRYDDLSVVTELDNLPAAVELLDHAQLGLLVPLVQHNPATLHQAPTLFAKWNRALEAPALSQEQASALRTPDELDQLTDFSHPRFAALLEARRYLISLADDKPPPLTPAARPRSVNDRGQLPPALDLLERGVIHHARAIARWRADQAVDVQWGQITDLIDHIPALFDFWLNYFAMEAP